MDVLRELRIANGLTQKEFSDILDVSQQAVSKWENNTAEPDISTLIKIAHFFEVTVDELLGLEPPKQIKKSEPEAEDSVTKDSNIAITLSTLRKEKHLTQKQLAAETGLSLSSIISYENGLREPNSKAMVILEKFFGVSGEYLYGALTYEEDSMSTIKFNNAWIRRQISAMEKQCHAYNEEFKSCEQQIEQLTAYRNRLKELMNIEKTNIIKLEEIINDEKL